MSLPLALIAATGAGTATTYVDDVFSAYTYTGNGSTQTITNGIDLAGMGGLVWIKDRDIARSNRLSNSVSGTTKSLSSDLTAAEITQTSSQGQITSFNSNGFSLGADSSGFNNVNNEKYASWTFRKAPKFFDVVTYTGNGSYNLIPHSLKSLPGLVIVKRTDTASDWVVYHRTYGYSQYCILNSTSGVVGSPFFAGADSTDLVFSTTDPLVNANGGSYIAYLFAHDASTDGLIQCGSFNTDASGNATVTLGWEPQFFLRKRTDSTGNWTIVDSARGFTNPASNAVLFPNLSNAESTTGGESPTATGIVTTGLAASSTYIYLAIRRPNKPPTTGTQVYNAITYTGNGATQTISGAGFAPDLVLGGRRNQFDEGTFDRLRGGSKCLVTSSTVAEAGTTGDLTGFTMDGFTLAANSNASLNTSAQAIIAWLFKRAPGVFDVVCYTGTGSAMAVAHSLGAVPELMIVKRRNGSTYGWFVYAAGITTVNQYLQLDLTNAVLGSAGMWNAAPTASVFSIGDTTVLAPSGGTFVAYLFASKAGISKVGSYTGNGSSLTINCGFTTGARFILIKCTSTTGDWYVWDTVRGIIAANDPHLSLNTTAAEVTTDDSIDPDTSGFIVNQVAATNINVNTATYIYLALA